MLISIQPSGSAFGETDKDSRAEVARILRSLAARIEGGENPEVVRDVNGNKCGTVRYGKKKNHGRLSALAMHLLERRF